MYVAGFNSNRDLHVQLGRKSARRCRFMNSQLEIRGSNWFSIIISYLLYFICGCFVLCTYKLAKRV